MNEDNFGLLGFILGIGGALLAVCGVWFSTVSALAAYIAAGAGLFFALRGWGGVEHHPSSLTFSGMLLNTAALSVVQILFYMKMLAFIAASFA